jgi:hypothetical protein
VKKKTSAIATLWIGVNDMDHDMQNDMRLLADIFPDVPSPSQPAWQLVNDKLMAAVAEQSETPSFRGNRRRQRTLVWSAAFVTAAAAALIVTVLIPGATARPRTIQSDWQLVSDIVSVGYQPDSTIASAHSITCPSASTCYVVTDSEVANPGLVNGAGPAHNEIPTPTSGEVTTNGGATWQTLGLPSGLFLDTNFSCPTVTTCMVGAVPLSETDSTPTTQLLLTSTNGGTKWTEQSVSIPADPGPDPSILKAGQGGTWSQLQCFDASTCLAFGLTPYGLAEQGGPGVEPVNQTVVMRTDDGGQNWTTNDLPWVTTPSGSSAWSNAEAANFSCANEQTCIGLAGVLGALVDGTQPISTFEWRTTDGGATWTNTWINQPFLDGGWQPLTCADSTHCLAIGTSSASTNSTSSALLRTTDGGATWQLVLLTAGGIRFTESVTCNTANECWAGGRTRTGTSVILASADGGTTWTSQTVPPDVQSVGVVACPTLRTCYAVATTTAQQETTELLINVANVAGTAT